MYFRYFGMSVKFKNTLDNFVLYIFRKLIYTIMYYTILVANIL